MEISSNFSLAGVQSLKGGNRSSATQATQGPAEASALAPLTSSICRQRLRL